MIPYDFRPWIPVLRISGTGSKKAERGCAEKAAGDYLAVSTFATSGS
jgi:hypothetical protein